MIGSYLELKDALVNDDFETSISNAQQFKEVLDGISMSLFEVDAHQIWMREGTPLSDLIDQMANASDIAFTRKPFKPLSEHMINLTQVFGQLKNLYTYSIAQWRMTSKEPIGSAHEDNIMNRYLWSLYAYMR